MTDYIYKNGPKPLVPSANGFSGGNCPSFQTDFSQIQYVVIPKQQIFGDPAPPFSLNQRFDISGAGLIATMVQYNVPALAGAAAVGPQNAIFVVHFQEMSPSQFVNYCVQDWQGGVGSDEVQLPAGILAMQVGTGNALYPNAVFFDKPFDYFYVSHSTVDTHDVTLFTPQDFVIAVTPCNATPISGLY